MESCGNLSYTSIIPEYSFPNLRLTRQVAENELIAVLLLQNVYTRQQQKGTAPSA